MISRHLLQTWNRPILELRSHRIKRNTAVVQIEDDSVSLLALHFEFPDTLSEDTATDRTSLNAASRKPPCVSASTAARE